MMEEKSGNITTRELWARLFQAPAVDAFFQENGDACSLPNFSEYINELCNVRQEKPGTVIKRSNIESSFGHRLFSGTRNPSRDTVLMLAFGFELLPDDTQQILKVARQTPLHPKVKRDAVIAWCLHHHNTVVEAQQILYEHHLPLMGGAKFEA
ncbi:MAG: hypothetical protein IJ733_18270 [Lachnospiraceae bacterium]|nr:hypothetical protein [Lachnospiraceae bacterium]